ncbi:tyrosine-type recombinase/integrase [Tardiphaga sp. 604_B6_N1_1]|uniref:tyrosine-type recombinase/integrase n=1 Tax=Tardiphaga sp. 604_B6_N1_1 TaxID=3240779 RepID=UPI003F26CCDB
MAKDVLTKFQIERGPISEDDPRRLWDTPGKYRDGKGLFLRIIAGNADGADKPPLYRNWVFHFTSPLLGKERQLGLGPYDDVSLAQARDKADEARALVLSGVDPIERRLQQRQAVIEAEAARRTEAELKRSLTFQKVTESFIAARSGGWKNAKHRQQWTNTLTTYAYPVIGALPVTDITGEHIETILRPIFISKTETAKRVRGRIEQIMDFAKARKYRSGDNPAAWKGNMRELLGDISNQAKAVIHHPRLPYGDIPIFMAKLRARDSISARALEVLILTAARTNEIIGMRDDELDLASKLWTIPAARMKAKRLHRVPLSDRAVDILLSLPREKGNPFLFVGGRTGSHLTNMAMLNLLEHMGHLDITVHGFRSSFKDWAHGETSAAHHAIELALAHVKRDKVEAAYHHDDMLPKRRALMTLWENYCKRMAGGIVTPLRRIG